VILYLVYSAKLIIASEVPFLHYRDEELLGQALDLNDKLQILLEKYDAIISGSPLPDEVTDVGSELPAGAAPNIGVEVAPEAAVAPTVIQTNVLNVEEDEDEDDEFALLARRSYCHDANCFISYAYFSHASFRADSYILSGSQSSGLQLHHLFQSTHCLFLILQPL
jgi:hypothetical protein